MFRGIRYVYKNIVTENSGDGSGGATEPNATVIDALSTQGQEFTAVQAVQKLIRSKIID